MDYKTECPYCGAEVGISPQGHINWGINWGINKTYKQECPECGKTFLCDIVPDYTTDSRQAPCLNGGRHDLRPMSGLPKKHFKDKCRCACCGLIVKKRA